MTEAWVTLATNDGYAQGALVLAHSLRTAQTTKKLHCMVTNQVSPAVRRDLEAAFDEVSTVDVLSSDDQENLALIGRPDLGVTFTKLHCWRLTQYNKAVFLDADTLVLHNCDELFERPEFAAAADIGWPDCFNSGVFVFVPSLDTYRSLLSFAITRGSFDGGDQGLLNDYFSNWRDLSSAHRLPFIYNMTAGWFYSYAAAWKRFGASTKIVHFIGARKPWHSVGAQTSHQGEHIEYWNQIYSSKVAPVQPERVHDSHSAPSTPHQSQYRTVIRIDAHHLPSPDATHHVHVVHHHFAASSSTPSQPHQPPPTVWQQPPSSLPEVPISHDVPCEPVNVGHHPEPVVTESEAYCEEPCSPVHVPSDFSSTHHEPASQPFVDQPPTEADRLRAWEAGNPDYMGADAFSNILSALKQALE